MARKKKVAPSSDVTNTMKEMAALGQVSLIGREDLRTPGTRVPEVREVAGARSIITIGPEHQVWGGGSLPVEIDVGLIDAGLRGAIVRILPPGQASDERVAWLVGMVKATGAAVVRVGPRRKARVVTDARAATQHASGRAVVMQLVEESNVDDRDALRTFCDAVMQRQGVS